MGPESKGFVLGCANGGDHTFQVGYAYIALIQKRCKRFEWIVSLLDALTRVIGQHQIAHKHHRYIIILSHCIAKTNCNADKYQAKKCS